MRRGSSELDADPEDGSGMLRRATACFDAALLPARFLFRFRFLVLPACFFLALLFLIVASTCERRIGRVPRRLFFEAIEAHKTAQSGTRGMPLGKC